MKHITYLKSIRACAEGLEFASRFPTLQDAWDACTNLEHMKWLLYVPIYAEYSALIAEYEVKRPPIDAEYRAKCTSLDAEFDAKRAPIYACKSCDELRAKFSCPEIK